MNPQHLLDDVVKHTNNYLANYTNKDGKINTKVGNQLVMATAAPESDCGEYLHQLNSKQTAKGILQMEMPTAMSVLRRTMVHYPRLYSALDTLYIPSLKIDENLIGNLYYAAGLCRICYYLQPEPIPMFGDRKGM